MTDIKARKSLGQHWLTDDQALQDIINLADIRSTDEVVEIGPGMGVLTKLLANEAKHVTAVELDSNLVIFLNKLNLPNVDVYNSDILAFNFSHLSSYKIVANIPYYLTGKIIKMVSELKNKPDLVVLLVQKEIAERLSAQPGNLSILGLTTQFFFDVLKGPVVTSDKFDPPPKVDSQIVKLVPKRRVLEEKTEKELFRLIKIGFSSKRKTILNNLSAGYMKDKTTIRNILNKAEIEPTLRPQTISLDSWIKLLNYL